MGKYFNDENYTVEGTPTKTFELNLKRQPMGDNSICSSVTYEPLHLSKMKGHKRTKEEEQPQRCMAYLTNSPMNSDLCGLEIETPVIGNHRTSALWNSLMKEFIASLPVGPLTDDSSAFLDDDDGFTFKTVSTDDEFTFDSIEEDEVTSKTTSIRNLEKPEASGSSHETKKKQSNRTSDVGIEKQSSRQYKEKKSNDMLKKDSSRSKKLRADNFHTDSSQCKKEKRPGSSSKLKKESSDSRRKLKKDSSSLESQLNESSRTVKKSNRSKKLQKISNSRMDESRDNVNRREHLSGSRRVSFSSKCKWAYFEQRTQEEKNASFYSQKEYKRIYKENINTIQKMESKTKLSASETKHFRGLLAFQAMNEREQRIKFTVSQVLREQEKSKTLGDDWVKDFSNKFSKQTAIAALNLARMDAKAARSYTRRAPPVLFPATVA